ncbi:DUF6544 family protein [Paenibacillus aceti]|uniref:Uncharacterized protein n=1 Tax=Paenibacillus aceti TaxID=1820010 RepID=A0ABQ1W413_9BACL|nr:DUF6544 family protein [Paenibacillus aceti]GGG11389.1 hypothetical protein GCM10010913_36510 [Paenibacillus aceti]
MWTIIAILAVIIVGILIFLNIPYSTTKAGFERTVTEQLRNSEATSNPFTLEDIEKLPEPLQKYFTYSGYIGTPKMSHMKIAFKQVDFMMSPDKPAIKIDYTQYNFVREPVRFAYIDTSMYGIPFEGLDSYIDGHGGMKGVLGKVIPLFNQTGEEMDQAALVTFLSESLVVPHAVLQDYITWESVDATHAKATIIYKGVSASGIFTFNEVGEPLSFTTEDRSLISTDGMVQQVTWSAFFKDYKTIDGIRQPTHLQAVWNLEQGDLVYFDSDDFTIEYGMK